MPGDPPDEPARRSDGPVLLFDGVCNLCNGSVQFVIEHDPEGRIRFAPLQSGAAQDLLDAVGYDGADLDSVVLVEGETYYTKSTAALRVARLLGLPWSLAWAARVVPRALRDVAYDLVAEYRYAVFGKRDQCMVPTPEVRDRFLATDDAPGADAE